MPNKKEVRQHIASVSDIQTITSAMYMIASTKLRKAKVALENARPCFDSLEGVMKNLCEDARIEQSRYFGSSGGVPSLIVVTSDKGLAGPYNYNVIRKANSFLEETPGAKLFCVGDFGRRYYRKHGRRSEETARYNCEGNLLKTARFMAEKLLERYNKDELNEINIVYTDFEVGMPSEVRIKKLLPIERTGDTFKEELFPSAIRVLEGVVPEYITSYLYGALTDSYCSEQSARMKAMDAANRNAEKLLGELSLLYDHIRQNSITQEIIEVSAGVRKHKKGEK